jgi:hypothetical protein
MFEQQAIREYKYDARQYENLLRMEKELLNKF